MTEIKLINTIFTENSLNLRTLILLIMTLVLAPVAISAQYKIDPKASSVKVKGTSTIHNWTVTVEQIKGSLKADIDANQIKKIDAVDITIPVLSMKTSKQDMTERMHEALKSKQFPEITYKLKSYTLEDNEINITGALTIAGVTKIINSKVTYQAIGKLIKFSGETIINMSDFNIKRPEFFLGSVKTGDKTVVRYFFTFSEN